MLITLTSSETHLAVWTDTPGTLQCMRAIQASEGKSGEEREEQWERREKKRTRGEGGRRGRIRRQRKERGDRESRESRLAEKIKTKGKVTIVSYVCVCVFFFSCVPDTETAPQTQRAHLQGRRDEGC